MLAETHHVHGKRLQDRTVPPELSSWLGPDLAEGRFLGPGRRFSEARERVAKTADTQ